MSDEPSCNHDEDEAWHDGHSDGYEEGYASALAGLTPAPLDAALAALAEALHEKALARYVAEMSPASLARIQVTGLALSRARDRVADGTAGVG